MCTKEQTDIQRNKTGNSIRFKNEDSKDNSMNYRSKRMRARYQIMKNSISIRKIRRLISRLNSVYLSVLIYLD